MDKESCTDVLPDPTTPELRSPAARAATSMRAMLRDEATAVTAVPTLSYIAKPRPPVPAALAA